MLLPGLYTVTGAFAQDDNPIQIPPDRYESKGAAGAPAPGPAPQPAPPGKVYLELDQADLVAVSQALNELPKRVADPLIVKLNAQLQNQPAVVSAAAGLKK
jgi:hypothetical protein